MSSRVHSLARQRETARTREELDALEVSRAANDAVQVVLSELDLVIVGWAHLACGGLVPRSSTTATGPPSACPGRSRRRLTGWVVGPCPSGAGDEWVPVYRVRGLEGS